MFKKDNNVFNISILMVAIVAIWGIVSPESLGSIAGNIFNGLTLNFGWFYLMVMFIFVLFVLFLAFSKYGKIKLGPDDSKPDYSTMSWFAMLFSAGMGIGLVFWGAAEPLNHFVNPAYGITPGTPEAADFAMFSSFMHWGISPWANYAIIALPLAYMQFRRNKPALVSSTLIPLLGEERASGWMGKLVDILAIFATVAGLATSLGLGVLQINSGLNYLFGIPINNIVSFALMAGITVIVIWTAVAGIEKGISAVSNLNIVVAFIIMVLLFLLGPTRDILNSFTNSLGAFLSGFVQDSLRISTYGDNSWLGSWRVFYWAWWIAWAPFVGVFIARISKGRTIREFVMGVTMVPALGSFVWFAIFGTTGISQGLEVATQAIESTETALFIVLENIPFGSILSMIAILLLFTFFITSANSGTFVLGMMSRNGVLDPDNKTKTIWGIVQALLAYALLVAGGLEVLQTASIVVAFPFGIVMLVVMASFVKGLQQDMARTEAIELKEEKELIQKIHHPKVVERTVEVTKETT